jgi:hypothetical protein
MGTSIGCSYRLLPWVAKKAGSCWKPDADPDDAEEPRWLIWSLQWSLSADTGVANGRPGATGCDSSAFASGQVQQRYVTSGDMYASRLGF